jgi:hypothetical protein
MSGDMDIRFFKDPETDLPHVYDHNVDELDVMDVLHSPLEDRAGTEGSRVAIGQTRAGRYLRVIYRRDQTGDGIFVITAYDLSANQLKALRRRQRRRPQ